MDSKIYSFFLLRQTMYANKMTTETENKNYFLNPPTADNANSPNNYVFELRFRL